MVDLNRILTSNPVNGVSARVVSGGERYIPDKIINQAIFEVCPDVKKYKGQDKDLSGSKFGEFTVIGIYGS